MVTRHRRLDQVGAGFLDLLALAGLATTLMLACGSDKETSARAAFAGGISPVSVNGDPPSSRNPTFVLSGVRLTEEAGFDRVVFEFEDRLPAAEIEYQQRAVSCLTGEPASVRGGPVLLVRFEGAAAHDGVGRLTAGALHDGPGKATKEVKVICNFEGELTLAVGVSGQKAFRVADETNPRRLVVDVRW